MHALARAGHTVEARALLERALDRFDSRELEALLRWLDQGAPSGEAREGRDARSESKQALASTTSKPRDAGDKRLPKDRKLAQVLVRGLSHLPLDARQRKRALVLARDALAEAEAAQQVPAVSRTRAVAEARAPKRKGDDVAGLAAAVAYAIVYVDHLPLSHAEVAAPFRVAVARLRGRFAELRAKLDIIPGDARYASTRTRGC